MPIPTIPPNRSNLYASYWTHARDAMVVTDSRTDLLIDANPATELFTGYSREELIGLHRSTLFPSDEHERLRDSLRDEGAEILVGFHVQRKDGASIPMTFSATPAFQSDGQTLILTVFRDNSELEKQAHRLATLRWALSAYASAAIALGHADSTEGLLQAICEAITSEPTYVLAWVGIAEDGLGKPVRLITAAGSATHYLDGLQVSWSEDDPAGNGPTGIAIRSGQLFLLDDAETSESYKPWREQAKLAGIHSSVTIPLSVEGSWHGALMVYANCPFAFEAVALEVFEHLAKEIGHGLHALHQKELLEAERILSAQAQTQLTEALSAMVAAMVTAVEKRDPYTAGHEGRVAEIAYAMGQELGWVEDRLQALRMAAMVHDIGKISVPTEILTKPGALDFDEREIMKGHPETGYSILKDIPFTWPIADIMRQHHEKLDGSGYPLGLTADQILPEAKVLAVADIVEAMTSNRPYRQGMDLEIVLREVEGQAGIYLDSEAVKACLTLFREKKFVLPGMVASY